jgi:hypothetical protein
MSDAVERWANAAGELSDPLDRLKCYITSTLERLSGDSHDAAMSKFVVSTRWRLHKQFPKELAEAEKPFVDLVRGEMRAAIAAGQLNPPDPEWDSWFVTELVRSVYHYYAFAARSTSSRNGCGGSA